MLIGSLLRLARDDGAREEMILGVEGGRMKGEYSGREGKRGNEKRKVMTIGCTLYGIGFTVIVTDTVLLMWSVPLYHIILTN